ncbi:MAG: hypothetical protein C4293_07375 [Nitrospiraceae bacterium]
MNSKAEGGALLHRFLNNGRAGRFSERNQSAVELNSGTPGATANGGGDYCLKLYPRGAPDAASLVAERRPIQRRFVAASEEGAARPGPRPFPGFPFFDPVRLLGLHDEVTTLEEE